MKLTNKQYTDYCEILNNFRCKAIDIIDDLAKAYKDTLAEDIDAKLNNYKQHNEELIVKICQLEQLQNQKAIECLKEVLEHFTNRPTYFDVARLEYHISDQDKKFIDYINNKIKELEGDGE